MLTGELRNKVDQVWNAFWSGGIANPLEVIEQITYLLFLRGLDSDQTREENKALCLKTQPVRIYPAGTDSKQPVNSQFLAACLRSQSGFVLEKVSEAGHGTNRLDAQGLQSIRIPRPGDALEQSFAIRIASIEALKATHRRALAALDALFASLQQQAFAGQL
ncbi:type I restriction-modification system subunit M N-terminal domain-containing protein [Acidovorax sp. SRB_24]|uniref:type I restriction-modification system subunit M N-terminal domain-containing protein n=1 Tax=Acidovorax sp. SRB_24 TaxID=1962700 RepID=UPI001F0CF8F1|nr:type I restriction-modification system subunit M N-terminal domain-containing protein [Acidovorax sp. SRB_24]